MGVMGVIGVMCSHVKAVGGTMDEGQEQRAQQAQTDSQRDDRAAFSLNLGGDQPGQGGASPPASQPSRPLYPSQPVPSQPLASPPPALTSPTPTPAPTAPQFTPYPLSAGSAAAPAPPTSGAMQVMTPQIGRASCRERV